MIYICIMITNGLEKKSSRSKIIMKGFILFMFIRVHVGHMWWVPVESRKGLVFTGARVISHWELPEVSAGK